MRKRYEDLTFADDFMFCHVMQDESICIRVIETLVGIQVDHIEYLNFQQSIHPDFDSRGVRFDVYVRDSDRVIDLEMQAVYRTDLLKRARYYQAMLDMDQLQRSMDYDALKESYVVFICMDDPFENGLPCYTFKRICLELMPLGTDNVALGVPDTPATQTSLPAATATCSAATYDDKSTTVFYNAGAWESSEDADVKAFLQFVKTSTPSSSLTSDIEHAVSTARNHDPWRREFMTLEMKLAEERKEGYAEGQAAGRAEGLSQGYSEGAAAGAAEQRAKDETELKAQAEEIQRLKALLEEMKQH